MILPNRYAVGIGVGKVGDLPTLNGARTDARKFCLWAAAHGYETRPIIDNDKNPVSAAQIWNELTDILKNDVDRLLIYFSGHGVSLPQGDYWLLSGCQTNSNECINVTLSERTARDLQIGQISIMADACRSSIPWAARINGSNLFPNPDQIVPKQPKVDIFFATRVGAIAQEVPNDKDPKKSYGVFSKCLFSALWGQEPEALAPGRAPSVVSSQSLADWLADQIPLESGKIPGAAVQYPDTRHGWGNPLDTYWPEKVDLESARNKLQGSFFGGQSGLFDQPDGDTADLVGSNNGDGDLKLKDMQPPQKDSARVTTNADRNRIYSDKAALVERVNANHRQILEAAGRESFETAQGFTVSGMGVRNVVAPPTVPQPEFFEEIGNTQIRCFGGPQSLAIELADGRWIGTASLPDFIGTILVDERAVLSLNFALSRSSPKWGGDMYEEQKGIDAAARWTALQNIGGTAASDDLVNFAKKIRMGKHANPTLGILAAYAFDRGRAGALKLGDYDSADSIASFFASENGFVPFDVAFLASTKMSERPMRYQGKSGANAAVAGSFPLMTQGWALLEADLAAVHPALLPLRAGLLHGLWTCFKAEEGHQLAALIKSGGL